MNFLLLPAILVAEVHVRLYHVAREQLPRTGCGFVAMMFVCGVLNACLAGVFASALAVTTGTLDGIEAERWVYYALLLYLQCCVGLGFCTAGFRIRALRESPAR